MRFRNLMLVLIWFAAVTAVHAQTMSFEEAGKVILASCGKDINKYCANVNLGGGGVKNCLLRNPLVSSSCKNDFSRVIVGVSKRAEARVKVLKICDADVRRLCGLIEKGDGRLLECMLTAKRGVSVKCNQAITDAGYR